MSEYLINEYPLLILPSLAKKIGLNEAIVLQQIHYWVKDSKKIHDGKRWTYNSAKEWQKQFPFWSESTIRRTVNSLRKKDLIFTTSKYNKLPMDNTLWFSINYETFYRLTKPSSQNEQTEQSEWTDDEVRMDRAIPDTSPDTSPDKEVVVDTITEALQFYQKNIAFNMSSFEMKKIQLDAEEFDAEMIIHAMKIALKRNKKYYSYVEGILNKWRNEGITSMDQVIAKENQKKSKSVPTQKQEASKSSVPVDEHEMMKEMGF